MCGNRPTRKALKDAIDYLSSPDIELRELDFHPRETRKVEIGVKRQDATLSQSVYQAPSQVHQV